MSMTLVAFPVSLPPFFYFSCFFLSFSFKVAIATSFFVISHALAVFLPLPSGLAGALGIGLTSGDKALKNRCSKVKVLKYPGVL